MTQDTTTKHKKTANITHSVADVAAILALTPTLEGEKLVYVGANPFEDGADDDGFFLYGNGEFLGSAYDRNLDKKYSSAQVAKLADIPYEEYEPYLSHPDAPKTAPMAFVADGKKYDTRTLEERGLRSDAKVFFGISAPRGINSDWGESRDFPTFYPDGKPARSRRKFRFPERQLTTKPDKKPVKTLWDTKSAERGQPVAYALNWIKEGEAVWLVNSELAVWLFWQEGIRAICPLGENRNAKNYTQIVGAVQSAGAIELCVLLDNDVAGHRGALKAHTAATDLNFPVRVFDLGPASKIGFDASDLWEFYDKGGDEGARKSLAFRETMPFYDFLETQDLASEEILKVWKNETARDAKKQREEAAFGSMKLGTVDDITNRTDKAIRKCPKCARFAVIPDRFKGGFLCWQKMKGCGSTFESKDEKIQTAPVKQSDGDPVRALLDTLSAFQLFHTVNGDTFIVVEENEQKKTYDISSSAFESYVRHSFLRQNDYMIKTDALNLVLANLSALALLEGPELNSFVRTAYFGGRIYIDLCNKAGEVVEITSEGWKVTSDYPVFFRRMNGMLPLPTPERGNNAEVWERFKGLLNYGTEKNWSMIVAWLVTALCPFRWPCPILSIHGEQGSAKSWLTRLVRQTIDPNKGFMIFAVREERDVVVAAESSRVFALDNQENMEKWLSNLLAAMVTGTPHRCRKLHTDADERIFEGQPAMILNGIAEKIGGIDFNDRALKLFLPKLVDEGYKEESDIIFEWERLHPNLLAAIFDAMSCGLRNLPRKREILGERRKPRMADFTMWVLCCEEALPLPADFFYTSYCENIVDTAAADLDGLLPRCFIQFLDSHNGYFFGSATEIYESVKQLAIEDLGKIDLETVRANPNLMATERQYHESRILERAARELDRMKAFPNSSTNLSFTLTRIAPSLLKAEQINAIRHPRVGWEIRRLSVPRPPRIPGHHARVVPEGQKDLPWAPPPMVADMFQQADEQNGELEKSDEFDPFE